MLNLFVIAALLPLVACQQSTTETETTFVKKAGIEDYLGHWTIDVDGGGVGWLEVVQKEGYVDASLLWKGGSVVPVANVFLAGNGMLYVTRTSPRKRKIPGSDEERTHMVTNWFEATSDGEKLSGYLMTPKGNGIGVDSVRFEGVKLPDAAPAKDLATLKFGEPIELFNGKDLTGWKLINEKQVNGFKVVNGALVNDASHKPGEPSVSYGNLRTVDEFEDFNLTLEVNVPKGSNSGVYLRGIYEIQVLDSYGKELNSHNMGALYSRITPTIAAEKPAGEWQTLDITLADRYVTVILNGQMIINNQLAYGPTGGALHSDVFAPGPIYLQGDHGTVSFRNLILRPVVK